MPHVTLMNIKIFYPNNHTRLIRIVMVKYAQHYNTFAIRRHQLAYLYLAVCDN